MTIIKSRILQILLILMSIIMFAFSVFSYFYIEDDKYLCIADGAFLGILLSSISTFRIEYNEEIIIMKLCILKKVIKIKGIKEIDYSGIPDLCRIDTSQGVFYMPVVCIKKKVKKLIGYIKYINPEVRIFFNFC